jgi:hypothetical protein
VNKLGGVSGRQRFNTEMGDEARKAAFKEEGYTTNLEAIKAHMKKVYETGNPELMKKLEGQATEILKKHHIHDIDSKFFSHTQKEGILLYEDPIRGTKIINLDKESVSKESFFYVHTPDLDSGFLRVSPMKDAGDHMGVVNLNGEYTIQPKYTDIQVHDSGKKLFKVSETRNIGDTLTNGMKIESNISDIPGSKTVERIGLTDIKGNTLIETGYTEVSNTNDIMAQGLIR